jgi:uncharacterized membrane protein YsdA (DUF1294 family)
MVYLFSSNCFPLYQKIDKCQAISFNFRIKEQMLHMMYELNTCVLLIKTFFKKLLTV